MHIAPVDERRIGPYLKGGIPPSELWSVASVDDLLTAIRNYDRVFRLSPRRYTAVREHGKPLPDPWLPDALKRLYNHRCQICVHDFEPRYGVPYADTRLVEAKAKAAPVSTDLVVLCPNHTAIVGVAIVGVSSSDIRTDL